MATTQYTLSDSAWTDVGAGACLISIAESTKNLGGAYHNGTVQVGMMAVGGVAPAGNSAAYHTFSKTASYNGTEHVYLQSVNGSLVVNVTPVS